MSFFDAESKRRIAEAVKEAESKTAGEIVVVVRPASAGYRHVDGAVGLVAATAFLCVFLYWPEPFDFTWLPLELAGAFVFGALLSLGVPPLKRALLRRTTMARELRRSACEAFVERGVHRTRGRTGVLVCVSAFERLVDVVADVGVREAAATPAFADARAALETAVRRHDAKAFAAAIVALGAAMAEPLPRAADDENELPDAPQEVA